MPARPGAKALAVLAAAVTGGALLSGCGSPTTESSSYTVDGRITSLRVKTSGGAIDVVTGSGSTVKVTETLRYSDDKPKTRHETEGGELVLTGPSDCGGGGIGGSTCEVSYRVEVPSALAATLQSDGGDITVDGGVAGKLTARSDGGSVKAGFAAAPDSVDVDSSGGNVTLRVPEGSYAVDAATGGGDQKVGVKTDPSSAHKVRARSDGGRISVIPVA
ncbi:DUF4097 family beta strand repeat-containing protein [Streptomyces sp. NPDC049577]|uniref:DUF4097 family beta strand repeat-containing protein n=1 Tax=Streptomyces sp. NPDC049577 TaxID=3155153 RepID=UPI003449857E